MKDKTKNLMFRIVNAVNASVVVILFCCVIYWYFKSLKHKYIVQGVEAGFLIRDRGLHQGSNPGDNHSWYVNQAVASVEQPVVTATATAIATVTTKTQPPFPPGFTNK